MLFRIDEIVISFCLFVLGGGEWTREADDNNEDSSDYHVDGEWSNSVRRLSQCVETIEASILIGQFHSNSPAPTAVSHRVSSDCSSNVIGRSHRTTILLRHSDKNPVDFLRSLSERPMRRSFCDFLPQFSPSSSVVQVLSSGHRCPTLGSASPSWYRLCLPRTA